jgi:hypothetical protein
MAMPRPGDRMWLPAILGLCFILGVTLIVVPVVLGWSWDYGVTKEIGTAVMIVALLGLTVDLWLKTAIARDVFEAALGYVFPEEFRAEVRQITSYKFFCERHRLEIKIEPIDDECVRVIWSVERLLKNISSTKEPINGYVHIDEYHFRQASSEIFDCEVRLEGQAGIGYKEIEKDSHTLWAKTDAVEVPPQQYVYLRSKAAEIKRINDQMSLVFLAPTRNPETFVDIPEHLDCGFGFGTPNEKKEKSKYSHHYIMTGTYFPHQHMSFRWWPKAP